MHSSHPKSRSRILAAGLSTTGKVLRGQLWLRPLVAALILAGAGWWLSGMVERVLKEDMAQELQTLLGAEVKAMRIWFKAEETNVKAIAKEPDVQKAVQAMVAAAADPRATEESVKGSPELEALRGIMRRWVEAYHYAGWGLVTADGRVIASDRDEVVFQKTPLQPGLLQTVFDGQPTVTRPQFSSFMLADADGTLRRVPMMYAVAPVRDRQKHVIAALSLRIPPENEFTEILSLARPGQSGETYAFDENGLMLSESRFEDDLRRIGLLPPNEDIRSILTLHLKDPEVNLAAGEARRKDPKDLELTRMAGSAARGEDGCDVDGYRDYRGVPVIGAWTWLPEYGMGVATEVDTHEAYRSLVILRVVFWSVFGLLVALAAGLLLYMLVAMRLRAGMRRAMRQIQRLGQYTLEEKIGAGGMGVVYRAEHALLRRPTAIKLLDAEKTNDAAIARFEREVQLTSQLNHPNTIAVYDYGRTPDGIFYYAMEYLDGIPLDALVERFGPQPEGRVIHILRQVCGSLAEAHGVGLIHRDIKPANLILNRRGGLYDVVKVLDFGLVKALDARQQATLTAAGSLTGTPQYMAPEAIDRPLDMDPRSDLYAVGAVGYFLVTGTPLFECENVMELLRRQMYDDPERPSARLGRRVSAEFEAVLLRCLAKAKGDRPASAEELADELDRCPTAGEWTRRQAREWWDRPGVVPHRPGPATRDDGSDRTAFFDRNTFRGADSQDPAGGLGGAG